MVRCTLNTETEMTYISLLLLRECKRHTALHVASAHFAGWDGGGGLPHAVLDGGHPIQSWMGGYPILLMGVLPPGTSIPGLDRGVPHSADGGVPQVCPHPYLGWGTPHPDLGWGTPPIQNWDGVTLLNI